VRLAQFREQRRLCLQVSLAGEPNPLDPIDGQPQQQAGDYHYDQMNHE
jgi:hypothetical protein